MTNSSQKPSDTRLLYFHLVLDTVFERENIGISHSRDQGLPKIHNLAYHLVLSLARYLVFNYSDNKNKDIVFSLGNGMIMARDRTFEIAFDSAINIAPYPELKMLLVDLRKQVPTDFKKNHARYIQWWRDNGITWIEQLRYVMTTHCNIGHDWKFDDHQKSVLLQYYDGTKLILDCLAVARKTGNISIAIESHILDTLLLPIAEIDKRKREQKFE